jgi:Fe-Mn family superoxide dismutase
MGEDLREAQESAGFHEPDMRYNISGHFNKLFFWSLLENADKINCPEPQGKLAELVNKGFTDFATFKTHFEKVAQDKFLPGWVWLGVKPDGNLVITQTNNEDNPMMMGIA